MILSIIIPVYNVERYVEQCVRSCSNICLGKKEYEIIVVDDGSPDRSLAILNKLSLEIPNLKILCKPNGGLSSARNHGLNHAVGKYIWFVDSDDYIDTSNLSVDLLEILEAQNVDAIAFNWIKCLDDGTRINNDELTKIKQNQCGLNGFQLFDNLCDMFFAPRFIFNRKVFDLYRFKEGIYFEDIELIPRIVLSLDNTIILADQIYFYRQREGSILSNLSSKLIIDSLANSRYYFDLASTCSSTKKKYYIHLAKVSFKCAFHYVAKGELGRFKKEVLTFRKENNIVNLYSKEQKFTNLLNLIFNKCPSLIIYLIKTKDWCQKRN